MLPALATVRTALDPVAEGPVWARVLSAVNAETTVLRANISGAAWEASERMRAPAPRAGKQIGAARVLPPWYSMTSLGWLPEGSQRMWAQLGDRVWLDVHSVAMPVYLVIGTQVWEGAVRW